MADTIPLATVSNLPENMAVTDAEIDLLLRALGSRLSELFD